MAPRPRRPFGLLRLDGSTSSDSGKAIAGGSSRQWAWFVVGAVALAVGVAGAIASTRSGSGAPRRSRATTGESSSSASAAIAPSGPPRAGPPAARGATISLRPLQPRRPHPRLRCRTPFAPSSYLVRAAGLAGWGRAHRRRPLALMNRLAAIAAAPRMVRSRPAPTLGLLAGQALAVEVLYWTPWCRGRSLSPRSSASARSSVSVGEAW